MIDQLIKSQFPVFSNNPNLVYLDSANTSLTHQKVIDKLTEYYKKYPANVKRGIYKMSEKATEEFEKSRKAMQEFVNAKHSEEIIFTRGTTESINLVAYALGRKNVDKGDEIAVSVMEHHSNFVPWQALAQEVGALFKVIDINNEGRLDIYKNEKISLKQVVTKKTKILALPYVSNVLGTINPLKEIIKEARSINHELIIVIDAAQAASHIPIDVQDLDCDFLALSGHKMFGPKGVGILYGKKKLLGDMFPFQFGGEMIEEVQIAVTRYAQTPHKFEAGTPAIADVIALQEAVRFINELSFNKIQKHDKTLIDLARNALKKELKEAITLYGPSHSTSVISFSIKGIHPHDIASVLDEEDICVRAGHHCTMPLHTRLGIVASSRLSVSVYNNEQDIEKLVKGLQKAYKLLSKA